MKIAIHDSGDAVCEACGTSRPVFTKLGLKLETEIPQPSKWHPIQRLGYKHLIRHLDTLRAETRKV